MLELALKVDQRESAKDVLSGPIEKHISRRLKSRYPTNQGKNRREGGKEKVKL